MRRKKVVLGILVVSLILSQAFVGAGAYSDVPEDAWYSGVVNKWGPLLTEDDVINPEAPVTRAEFAHILNSIMKFPAAQPTFSDVAESPYAAAIGALENAGVVNGVGDGLYAPDATLERYQVALMYARAFGLEPQGTPQFTDLAEIPAEAVPYINSLQESGYFHGNADGSFAPRRAMKRAEVFRVVENAASNYVDSTDPVTEVVSGNMIINTPGAVVQDVKVVGDIVIAPGVGDGDVTLENVELTGTLFVKGGGSNSVHIKGSSSMPRVFVGKNEGGGVRIVSEGTSSVAAVVISGGKSNVLLEGSMGSVTMASATVTLTVNATVESLNVAAANSAVTVAETASVANVFAAPEATGTKLDIAGKVENVVIAAPSSSVAIAETAVVAKVGVAGAAAGAAVDNKGTVAALTVTSDTVTVANTGKITTAAVTATVTITGTAAETSSTVAAASVNDVYVG